MLTARTHIVVPNALGVVADLCRHFREHGTVEFDGTEGRISQQFGSSVLRASPRDVEVTVSASDAVNLAYMKLGIAEHVLEFSNGTASAFRWRGDGEETVTPPFFREMRVVASRRTAPKMQRLTLAGEDLLRFATGGLHIRLIIPRAGQAAPWPVLGPDGRIVWPGGAEAPDVRIYTIRRVDIATGTLDVDMVLHPGAETPGARFAEQAQPGDRVGIMGPGGGFVPQANALALFGDETALPAIARIVQARDSELHTLAVVEIDHPETMTAFDPPAGADVCFLLRGERPAGSTALLAEAVRDFDWGAMEPDVNAWVGCEFLAFKAIRRFLRKDLELPCERHLAVAYWRLGLAGDEARAPGR